MQDAPEKTAEAPRASGRGAMWWLGWGLGLLGLVTLALVAGLWLRMSQGPLMLPETLRERIETRLDQGMAASRIAVGEMALDLPEGGRAPVMEFRDVRLSDPGGAPRAAFPALRVQLDAGALLSGHVRPRRVEVTGAGLQLSRDARGRFDFDLSGSDAPARVSIPETMARLDAMLGAPAFASLEEITASGLGLAMTDEMTGQVIRIEDATARLTRSGGRLAMTVGGALSGSRATRLDIAVLRDAGARETEIAAVFRDLAARDLATASPALAWLDLMRAPISGRLAIGLGDDGTVGDMEAVLNIGPGRVRLGDAGAPLGFERVAADMRYDPDTRRLTFSRLSLDAPELRFTAAGHADVAPDGTSFVTQLRLSDIEAQPEGLFDTPVAVDGAAVDLRLSLAPEIRIELGEAVIHDGDLRLSARGEAVARPEGLSLSFDATLAEADIATILSYWPASAAAPTRRWLAEKVDSGRVEGVEFSLRRTAGQVPRRHLQLGFADVEMRPLRGAPPLRESAGYVELDGTRMVARIDRGSIGTEGAGDVELGGTVMIVPDTRPHGPEANFRVEARGALNDLMRLLDGPPFTVFRGDLTPERIGTGEVVLTAEYANRLIRRNEPASLSDLGLHLVGEVTDYASDGLVPGRRISADSLQVELVPDLLSVAGQAEVAGVPVTGRWERPLGPDAPRASRLDARARIDREGLARQGLSLPVWLISGRGTADLSLDLPDGQPPRLRVESDLDGLVLSLPALGWRSTAAETGRLAASVRLGAEPEVTELSLDAPGLELAGRATLLPGGGLARLTAEKLRAGDWLDVTVALVGRGAGVPPAIEIAGGTVRLQDAPPLGEGEGGESGPLTVRLDRLEVGDGIALTDLSGTFETRGGLAGEFASDVNGEAAISGVVAPGSAGPDLRIVAPDGGAVLRAAGIFRRAHGGEMTLTLQSTGAPRSFDGALRIEGPRLRDAPAMAELLNLISVVGLLEQLSGDGINLGTVEARFRLTPERLTLAEGTALGPALGISMDGVYDIASRRYDMQGVVSPLYMVNGLVGALFAPRREGLFGFSYRLSGTGEDAEVSVNPLSILTPGIFREIFRRPPPDLTETPGN